MQTWQDDVTDESNNDLNDKGNLKSPHCEHWIKLAPYMHDGRFLKHWRSVNITSEWKKFIHLFASGIDLSIEQGGLQIVADDKKSGDCFL